MTIPIETANRQNPLRNPAGAHPWSRREGMEAGRPFPFSALKPRKYEKHTSARGKAGYGMPAMWCVLFHDKRLHSYL